MKQAANIVGLSNEFTGASPRIAEEPLLNLRQRIEQIEQMPPMPEMTAKILKLSLNPDGEAKDLVKIVELDPSLAALIMRYASSPFFSYRGQIDSVFTAITRVLGYNTVMNLALGATASRTFKIPKNLPLGLDAHWQHAIFSAALAQSLSATLPADSRPPAGIAYLAGLLHNFGHLVLGHLFRQEFLILNKFINASPERPIVDIEKEVLGTTHGEIGSWLLSAWQLPEEIIHATQYHHDENDHGPHAVYSHLIRLTDILLKTHGIGDASDSDSADSALEYLGITEYQALNTTNKIMEERSALDDMASNFSG